MALTRQQLVILKSIDNETKKRGDGGSMYMGPDVRKLLNLGLIEKVPGYIFGSVFTITETGKQRLTEEWDDAILK